MHRYSQHDSALPPRAAHRLSGTQATGPFLRIQPLRLPLESISTCAIQGYLAVPLQALEPTSQDEGGLRPPSVPSLLRSMRPLDRQRQTHLGALGHAALLSPERWG